MRIMSKNNERAKRAKFALSNYGASNKLERREALVDLLTDLMHYCDKEDLFFDLCVSSAGNHYIAENPTGDQAKGLMR